MAFSDNMIRWIEAVLPPQTQINLRQLLTPLFDRQTSFPITTAGLVIKAGASALAKTGAAISYYLANGILQKIAAATDMPALVGSVTNAKFNVYCFFVDQAGVTTSLMGTEGATLAAVRFPQFPLKKALIGFIIINPTGTGPFVGGTTALDDGTVVPNAVFISPLCGFDAACVTGL